MPLLGVNIDHIATLRELRHASFPDVLEAMRICENSGADSLVVHLREDRRHIQDVDVFLLKKSVRKKLNLEMSIAPEIVKIACRVRPDQSTLVPEKRRELTTEGGLDVVRLFTRVAKIVEVLKRSNIPASLFIEPDKKQIKAAKGAGAGIIEIHTGRYADSKTENILQKNYLKVKDAAEYARSLGLIVNAGHGLDYKNVRAIAQIPGIHELNIGYSIVCRAVFVGLQKAVGDMKSLVESIEKPNAL